MDLIIGVGNSIRCDDGLGPWLVESLPQFDHVTTRTVQQLTPELTVPLSRVKRVLFVDAHLQDTQVRLKLIGEDPASLAHSLSPSGLLALTHGVHGYAPQGWQLTIPGFEFGFGERFSSKASSFIPIAEKMIIGWIVCNGQMDVNRKGDVNTIFQRR